MCTPAMAWSLSPDVSMQQGESGEDAYPAAHAAETIARLGWPRSTKAGGCAPHVAFITGTPG